MTASYTQHIEELVDKHFSADPALHLPFCTLYNFICQVLTQSMLRAGTLEIGMVSPFYYILEKVRDFSPKSLEESFDSIADIQAIGMEPLIQCATLHIVFPQIHRGLYTITPDGENASRIRYASRRAASLECRDIALTNISLPFVFARRRTSEDFRKAAMRRLFRGERLTPHRSLNEIRAVYAEDGLLYREEALVPDEVFVQLGFSSADAFRKIRRAFVALGDVYLNAAKLVDRHLSEQHHYAADADYLWVGIAMERMSQDELRILIFQICGAGTADYEKFLEFFIGDAHTKKISNSFMPPFWLIGEYIYFMPGALTTLLGQRNLLISIQNDPEKRQKYDFDKHISKLFEPTLIARARGHFHDAGFISKTECRFADRSIDLVVYCKKSNIVLTIQAKATLPPENSRMVDRLETRVNEGLDQIEVFDQLPQAQQFKLFQMWFPEAAPIGVQHIRAVLVNSSFGSFSTWERIELLDVLPLNTYMLSTLLQKCSMLSELKPAVWALIDEVQRSSNPILEDKFFTVGPHVIKQEHYELMGENPQRFKKIAALL